MSQKTPNASIRCRVESCAYHCEDKGYCSLGAIQVEPVDCAASGKCTEESCCGSYRHR